MRTAVATQFRARCSKFRVDLNQDKIVPLAFRLVLCVSRSVLFTFLAYRGRNLTDNLHCIKICLVR